MAMDNVKPRGNRKRRKVCAFCVDKVEHIDYKDAAKPRTLPSSSVSCPSAPRSCPAAPPAPAPCISVS